MRRTSAWLLAVIVLLALTVSPASAAPSTVVAGFPNLFYTNVVVVQKGQGLNLYNLDIAPHNVYSAQAPRGSLFRSATIGFFKKTPVNGVKALRKGTYKFVCTLHPGMKGTLRVV